MANRLAAETSPYLRQHAGNPVDWYPWGADAFARARIEDKPVLLSVGYSACHWCHVMAHESFEDPETAALMNRLFVNVKVDREERPDVDTIYMQAVQGMTGQGGWPMTVFLTPDGAPFFAGTYFPPTDRHGLPGFSRVLHAAADAYRTRRSEVLASAARIRAALRPRPAHAGDVPAGALDAAVHTLVAQTDMQHGGFGAAPKFPHPMAVDLMLRRAAAGAGDAVLTAALRTLDAMARGGLHDQVGGGFHRYSVDERWAVPHFEKMLYDNAQLAPVYLHAYQLTHQEWLRTVCERTLDYMARELLLPAQGFAASQDADSPAGEGAYFVWTPAQLREVLGDDEAAFAGRVFGVTEAGNFEHGTTVLSLPRGVDELAAELGGDATSLTRRVDSIRDLLFTARRQRAAPARDDKVITAWNALAVTAFAEAGAVLQREDYALIARHTAQFLVEAMWEDSVVMRSWMAGRARVIGFLEDCAHLANALLTVYEANGEPRFFTMARDLCEQIVSRFRDEDGTYYDTASDSERLIVRPRTVDDNPVGAGQSAAAQAFSRLFAFTGETRWEDRALEIIRPLAQALPGAPLALASLGLALQTLEGPAREIAISGDTAEQRTRQLVHAAWEPLLLSRVIAWGSPDGVPLLDERPLVDGAPAAYVCERFTCQAPVTSASDLRAALRARPRTAG